MLDQFYCFHIVACATVGCLAHVSLSIAALYKRRDM